MGVYDSPVQGTCSLSGGDPILVWVWVTIFINDYLYRHWEYTTRLQPEAAVTTGKQKVQVFSLQVPNPSLYPPYPYLPGP